MRSPASASRAPGPAVALASALLLASASSARAQATPGCPDSFARWAGECSGGDASVAAQSCPRGHVIFVVGPGSLPVDVTRAVGPAFATAGELGASPVGDFADWGAVPEADRAAFDALVSCLRERPGPLLDALDAEPEAPHASGESGSGGRRAGASPLPWRAALGLALAVALAVRRWGARGLVARAGAPLALGAATFVVRRLVVPEAYFHQNGQGPVWIAHALGRPGSYGPGYEQLFGWAARAADDPDGAVFLVQGLLAALVPPATFAVARGIGAPRAVSWACALAVAVSPIEARLAESESYFAAEGALLVLAAAVLAATVRAEGHERERTLGAVSAGLLVAQVALVHPVAWLAAALVPGVLLCAPGPFNTQLRLAALAALGIGVVVAVLAGPDMLEVLRGPLGDAWLEPARHGDHREMSSGLLALLALVVSAGLAAVARPPLRRLGLAALLLALTVAVSWRGNLLGAAAPWVHHAYAWLYLGPAVAAVAGLVPQSATEAPAALLGARAHGICAVALVLFALVAYGTTWDETMTRATDAREAALVRIWREHLPEGAVVAHLERAERQIVTLPLHRFRDVPMLADEPAPDLTALGADVFVYRSGLCTTVRGRAFCEALEAEYLLEAFATASLPAAPSMEGLDYDEAEVEVGLYRLRDRRSASMTDEGSSAGRDGR